MNASTPGANSTNEPSLASSESQLSFPIASVKNLSEVSASFRTRLWWLTLFCVLVSVGLFWYSTLGSGELIEIEFTDTYGLKPEDRLKFHGVEIGAVEKIELNPGRDGVVVHVRMTSQTRSLAGEGARFWIVRPLVSLDSIQGLDTILGAKYLAIDPSPTGAKQASRFQGLDSAPIVPPSEGSLEITLDADSRGGLESNAPILYRGFRIGRVVQVGFASDARSVQARCAIDPEYRDLIRRNSKFWNRSGWRLDVGLSGIQLDADTLAQVFTGGIEVATPTEPEKKVGTGHRFKLYDKPDKEWAQWKPSIAHGEVLNRIASKLPQPIRLAMRWQERSFGFRKNQQRAGWCLPVDDGRVLCLSEQVSAPNSAIPDSIQFELAGLTLNVSQLSQPSGPMSPESIASSTTRFSIDESWPSDTARWPSHMVSLKLPDQVCDVFLAHPDAASVLAIDAARLSDRDSVWMIDDMVTMDRDYHGLPVVSAATSQVIGFLSIQKNKRMILAP
jgi:paraquat-inducible protein B